MFRAHGLLVPVWDLPLDVEPAVIELLRGRLNAAVSGRSFVDVADAVAPLLEETEFGNRPAVAAIISCLLESVVERTDDRVVVAGAANLARYGSVFDTSVAPLLEALTR